MVNVRVYVEREKSYKLLFFLKEITLFVLMENVLVSKEKHKCFFVPV